MKRGSKWTKRIGFLLAPALAATTTIAASSNQVGATESGSADGNNTVDTANNETRFELCVPDFGDGKIFSSTFAIENVDGSPITDPTGITFELTQGGNTTDVTGFVTYVEEAMDWTQEVEIDALFDVPLSNYFSPIKAPGLFGLGCASATVTTDNDDNESWDLEPFPTGTTLIAKRGGSTIATADMSGRITPWQEEGDNALLNIFGDIVGNLLSNDFNCNVVLSDVQTANDLFPCTPFSDMYNSLIDATGVRLHPSFAYLATIMPSLIVYGCLFDSDLETCNLVDGLYLPWLLDEMEPGVSATKLTNPSIFSSLEELLDSFNILPALQSYVNPSLPPKENEHNSVYAMVDFDFCISGRLMALLPLREPNGNEPPLFHLTSVGRGMADSLSDPRINKWPEIDTCFYSDQSLDFFAFITTFLIVELYIVQLLAIDIPMGNTNVLSSSSINANPIQLKSINRIPWTWNDNTLAAPRVGKPYADAVSANGSPAPTYSITSGALPTGLSLNSTTGAITGMPKRQGTFTFTIAATNAVGAMSQSFTLATNNIKPRLTAKRDNLLVTFKGRVSTSFKGKRVSLEEFKYGKWRTIQRVDVNKNGRFTASTFTQWKTRYRVVAGVSRSRVVTR